MSWRTHALDGERLYFDRLSGTNVLVRNRLTVSDRRLAPRVLQIVLHGHCNLSCSFCSRDQAVENRLTGDYLLGLLQDAEAWCVLEVAFGGGEPLLFPRARLSSWRKAGFARPRRAKISSTES